MKRLSILVAVALAACDSDDGDLIDYMPDDLPAGQCETEGTSTSGCETETEPTTSTSTTGGAADTSSGGRPEGSCSSTDECLGAGVCSAVWNAQAQQPDATTCTFACVGSFDDARWCADDAACCEEGATCTERGYCVPPEDGESAESTSAGGGDTDTTGAASR